MAGTDFNTGIGVLANSRLEVRNQGYARFAAKVGINDSGQPRSGTTVFEVWGDGRLLAKSRPMGFGEAAVPLEAKVTGVRIVELVARESGAAANAGTLQPAIWADAALLK